MSCTSLSEMPFFNISASQLLEDVLYNTIIKQNICESSEFYNNILKVCDNNVLQQLQFAYSTESHFNNLVTNRPIQLSVFHLNIRSLNKNINGLLHYLRLFDIEFDVLVLSEIWKYHLEFYCKILKNYHFIIHLLLTPMSVEFVYLLRILLSVIDLIYHQQRMALLKIDYGLPNDPP